VAYSNRLDGTWGRTRKTTPAKRETNAAPP
jgi:hypothetical protein